MAMSILVVTITLLLLYFIVCIQRRFSLVYTADDFHLCIQRRFSLVYTATIFTCVYSDDFQSSCYGDVYSGCDYYFIIVKLVLTH